MTKEEIIAKCFVGVERLNNKQFPCVLSAMESYASQQLEEKDKVIADLATEFRKQADEIERLKGLIEEQFKAYHDIDSFDRRWETYKTDHNL